MSVGAGDTIIVGGTSNFFEIKGAIIRPFIYEYKQSDSYQDLLNFALGFSSDAEKNNITASIVEDNRSYSKKVNLSEKIGNVKLEELYVGSAVTIFDKDVFVTGFGVTSGYYPANGQNFF